MQIQIGIEIETRW